MPGVTNFHNAGYSPQGTTVTVVSAPITSPALPPLPKEATLVNINPSTPKTTGDIIVVSSYRPMEGTPVPPDRFAAQGLLPRMPTDSVLEVLGQMESMNLLGEPQHAAHSSCCRTTINKEDRSLNTGGDCPAETSGPARLPTKVANTFGEKLCAINDDVSVIEASPFPTATAPRSPKIGVLRQVHPWGRLVIDFPSEELISSDDDDEE
uniref:Uncharacterized protein n=1 Tax=Romanomermis culicivorax TaxID=13658 RepID=A0A915INY5_ROMCU